jgi:hypothetical protein
VVIKPARWKVLAATASVCEPNGHEKARAADGGPGLEFKNTAYLAGTTGAGLVTGAFGQQEAANTAVAAAIRASLTSFIFCFDWLLVKNA